MEENKLLRGALYVVGTPIGNLSDFSPREAETLAAVDFIAAEDTRVTMKLLNHFGIKKPLVSYYEHNKAEKGGRIVDRILAGGHLRPGRRSCGAMRRARRAGACCAGPERRHFRAGGIGTADGQIYV